MSIKTQIYILLNIWAVSCAIVMSNVASLFSLDVVFKCQVTESFLTLELYNGVVLHFTVFCSVYPTFPESRKIVYHLFISIKTTWMNGGAQWLSG